MIPQGKRGGLSTTKEPPLISLVEKYLAENSNLSYINIDDMVDSLQSKHFRFARMQRRVFSNQIRSAYFEYCKRNPNCTALRNSAEATEGVNTSGRVSADADSDSDIEEIQNEYTPKKDIVNSQLNSLYSPSPARVVGVVGAPSDKASVDTIISQGHSSSVNPLPVAEPTLIMNSNIRKQVLVERVVTEENKAEDDTSDNDLEIIDEVQGDGVIKRASEVNGLFISSITSENHVSSNNPPPVGTPQGTNMVYRSNNNNITISRVDSYGAPFGLKPSNSENQNGKKTPTDTNLPTSSTNEEPSSGNHHHHPRYFIDRKYNPQASTPSSPLPNKGTKRKTPFSPNEGGIKEDLSPKKLKKEISVIQDSGYRLSDFAGSEKVVEEVCRLLMHLKHPEVYKTLGVTAPRGFLLHGPPGTGKTLLANSIAGELQMPLLKVTGTEFVSGISGESEGNIRDLFNQAVSIAPCIIFIDEIDSITPKRETAQREMERRIVAQLLSCVDDLMNHDKGSQVLLIGATNRVEAIDTALRRAGRFDREISLGIPDEKSRAKILEVICRNLRLAPGFDLKILAKLTPGYVGADLQALVREAAVQAVNKALISSHNEKTGNVPQGVQEPMDCDTERQNDDIMIVTIDIDSKDNIQVIQPTSEPNEVVALSEKSEIVETNNGNANLPSKSDVVESNEVATSSEKCQSVDLTTSDESMNEVSSDKSQTVEVQDESIKPEIIDEVQMSQTESTSTTTQSVENEKLEATTLVVSSTPETVQVENGEEKMQVDSTENEVTSDNALPVASSSSELPVPVVVIDKMNQKETKNEAKLEQTTETIKKIEVKLEEKPSYLRWIRETAPLDQEELDQLYIFMDDFEIALKHVQPSSKREGFATVPDTTWDDIGALKDIREELEVSILGPVKHSSAFEMLGLNTPAGVLLCGPPGCGKTLLAKAVANEAGINFISVKGPELLNMYVGESERAVRQCFLRAKNSSPCVIFFDELDALCPRRSNNPESGSGSRIVNQLLTEMDGIESRAGVFVMAATNRPDIIDPAILRPGRLDKILFVDLPTGTDRCEILKALTKGGTKPVFAADVDLNAIANKDSCEFYTGADLAALVREASIAAFKDLILDKERGTSGYTAADLQVSMKHFETAFAKTKPSVTKKDRDKYAEMKERYSSIGGR